MIRLKRAPRPAVLPTLAALVVCAITFAAGNWQTGRAHEKEVIETRHAALRDAAVMAVPRSVGESDLDALDGRRMSAQGEYLNDKTLYLDNQVVNRIAGYHVLTPLQLTGGGVVMVNRGWVAAGPSRAVLPTVVPIVGRVSVEGRAALPPRRVYEIRPDTQPGKVWQNLLLPAMSKQLDVTLLPFVLRLSGAGGDGLVRLADTGADPMRHNADAGMTAAKHRGYAFQWYSLAALTVLLFGFFTFFERNNVSPGAPSSAASLSKSDSSHGPSS